QVAESLCMGRRVGGDREAFRRTRIVPDQHLVEARRLMRLRELPQEERGHSAGNDMERVSLRRRHANHAENADRHDASPEDWAYRGMLCRQPVYVNAGTAAGSSSSAAVGCEKLSGREVCRLRSLAAVERL